MSAGYGDIHGEQTRARLVIQAVEIAHDEVAPLWFDRAADLAGTLGAGGRGARFCARVLGAVAEEHYPGMPAALLGRCATVVAAQPGAEEAVELFSILRKAQPPSVWHEYAGDFLGALRRGRHPRQALAFADDLLDRSEELSGELKARVRFQRAMALARLREQPEVVLKGVRLAFETLPSGHQRRRNLWGLETLHWLVQRDPSRMGDFRAFAWAHGVRLGRAVAAPLLWKMLEDDGQTGDTEAFARKIAARLEADDILHQARALAEQGFDDVALALIEGGRSTPSPERVPALAYTANKKRQKKLADAAAMVARVAGGEVGAIDGATDDLDALLGNLRPPGAGTPPSKLSLHVDYGEPVFPKSVPEAKSRSYDQQLARLWASIRSGASPHEIWWLRSGSSRKEQPEYQFLSDWLHDHRRRIDPSVASVCLVAHIHALAAQQSSPRSRQGPAEQTYSVQMWLEFLTRARDSIDPCYRHPDFPEDQRAELVRWMDGAGHAGPDWPRKAEEIARYFLKKGDDPKVRRELARALRRQGRTEEADRIEPPQTSKAKSGHPASPSQRRSCRVWESKWRRAHSGEGDFDAQTALAGYADCLVDDYISHDGKPYLEGFVERARLDAAAYLARRINQRLLVVPEVEIFSVRRSALRGDVGSLKAFFSAPAKDAPLSERLAHRFFASAPVATLLADIGRQDLAAELLEPASEPARYRHVALGLTAWRTKRATRASWRIAAPLGAEHREAVQLALEQGRGDVARSLAETTGKSSGALGVYGANCYQWPFPVLTRLAALDKTQAQRIWSGKYGPCEMPSIYRERVGLTRHVQLDDEKASEVESYVPDILEAVRKSRSADAFDDGESKQLVASYAERVSVRAWERLMKGESQPVLNRFEAELQQVQLAPSTARGERRRGEGSQDVIALRLGEVLARAGYGKQMTEVLSRYPTAGYKLFRLAALAEQSSPPSRRATRDMARGLSPRMKAVVALKASTWGYDEIADKLGREVLELDVGLSPKITALQAVVHAQQHASSQLCAELSQPVEGRGKSLRAEQVVPERLWERAGCPQAALRARFEGKSERWDVDDVDEISLAVTSGLRRQASELFDAWSLSLPRNDSRFDTADPRALYVDDWASRKTDGAADAVMAAYRKDQPALYALAMGHAIASLSAGRLEDARADLVALIKRGHFDPLLFEQVVRDLDGKGLYKVCETIAQTVDLDKQTNATILRLSSAALRAGDNDRAARWLAALVERSDTLRPAAAEVALAQAAPRAARRLLTKASRSPRTRLDLALAALYAGHEKRARKLLSKGFAERTSHPTVLAAVARAALVGRADNTATEYLLRLIRAPYTRQELADARPWDMALRVLLDVRRADFGVHFLDRHFPQLDAAAIAAQDSQLLGALADFYAQAGLSARATRVQPMWSDENIEGVPPADQMRLYFWQPIDWSRFGDKHR